MVVYVEPLGMAGGLTQGLECKASGLGFGKGLGFKRLP